MLDEIIRGFKCYKQSTVIPEKGKKMRNYNKIALFTTMICPILLSATYGGSLQVINNADKNVQIFIRGAKSDKHHTELLVAGETKNLAIKEENVDGKPIYEVIASTGNGGDPDWKLLGGECIELLTTADHVLLIESKMGGLKTSCKDLLTQNPK